MILTTEQHTKACGLAGMKLLQKALESLREADMILPPGSRGRDGIETARLAATDALECVIAEVER